MGHCQSYPSANYPNNRESEETTYQNLTNSGMKKYPGDVVYESGIPDEHQDYNLSGTKLNSTYPYQLGTAYGGNKSPGYDQPMIRGEMDGPYPSNLNVNEYNQFNDSRTTQKPLIVQTNYRQNEPGSNTVNVRPNTIKNTGTSAAHEMPRAAKVPGENNQTISPEKDEPNLTFTGAPAVQVDVNVNFGGGYRMQNSSVNAPASTGNSAAFQKIVGAVGKNANPESNIINPTPVDEGFPAVQSTGVTPDSPAVPQDVFTTSYKGIPKEVPTPAWYDKMHTEVPITDSYNEIHTEVPITDSYNVINREEQITMSYDEMTAGKVWQYDPVVGYNVLG